MARLGHSSARAALIYQHASEERERRIASGLDDLVRRAAVSPARAPGVVGDPEQEGAHLDLPLVERAQSG